MWGKCCQKSEKNENVENDRKFGKKKRNSKKGQGINFYFSEKKHIKS